jgi:multidrug efflux pump subunit AcrA (membrane-fusion protein)
MSAIGNPRLTPIQAPPSPAPQTAPPAVKPPSRGTQFALIAIVLLGGFLAWQFLLKPATITPAAPVAVIRTAKVTTGPLTKTVRLAGQTSSREFVNITAPIARGVEAGREMILLFLIPSGSRVKKGDMLAQIDMKSIEDHIDDVKDDVEKSEGDIRKRKAEQSIDTENMMQTIRVSKAQLEKAKLDQKGGETRTTIDQELLKLSVEEADAAYKQSLADVDHKKVSQLADVFILGVTKKRHENHLGRHASDLERYTMKSPIDGLVVVQQTFRGGEMSIIQQGDQIYAGQLFLKVVRPDRMQVEASINQSESDMFRIGQRCKILFDAFPGMSFPGKVYSIGAMATGGMRQNYFIRNVPVKISIDGVDPRLIPDLSASVDVVVAEEANVRQIPASAIHQDPKTGKDVVYVKKGSGFEQREVQLGLRTATHAAVTAGLEVGEEVALDRPKA